MTVLHLSRGCRVALLAAFAGLCVFGSSMASAQNVAVVNGKPIPQAKAEQIVATLVAQGQKDTPELRDAVRRDLVNRAVLEEQAEKDGIAGKPEVQAQLERARQQVLIGAMAQAYFKAHPPTDSDVRVQYDLLVKQTAGRQYKARHILVPTLAEARAITAKLKAGARFEELAKQSKDPGSANNGGELDWAPASTYGPEFADALTKLTKGQTTPSPVKTQFGYHVIRLDDVRDAKVPTFEESRANIVEAMTTNTQWQQAQFERMMAELMASAKVE